MTSFRFLAALAGLSALSACVAPVGPVQVTRFHVADTSALGQGPIAVVPAPGADGASLEWKTWQAAVLRQLTLIGYTPADPATGGQIAEMRVARSTFQPARTSSPVSVGLGGSTGSFGSGVGLGIGVDLSGAPKPQVATELGVIIKERTGGQALWDGRASFTVQSGSPLADSALASAKVAEALFKDFPGVSGETIEVR